MNIIGRWQMEKKGSRRMGRLPARHSFTRYACLLVAAVLLISMCVSGCRNKQGKNDTAPTLTETVQADSGQAAASKEDASSEDGTSGGSGLADLPLISDLRKEENPGNDAAQTSQAEQPDEAGQPSQEGQPEATEKPGQPDEAGQPEETEKPGQPDEAAQDGETAGSGQDEPSVVEDGRYNTKDEVALYIHLFGHLPSNFITKSEAEELGWESSKGNLADVAPGMSIGGNRFGNYEKRLPSGQGRTYYECDINYVSGRRGAERIVFSNDGLVFYTNDHYESFEQLY
jgi:outer membrane murein-binding lipoprotein Lpp